MEIFIGLKESAHEEDVDKAKRDEEEQDIFGCLAVDEGVEGVVLVGSKIDGRRILELSFRWGFGVGGHAKMGSIYGDGGEQP